MRQRRWLELLKDYDYTIECHPRKANVVADVLSRKSSSSSADTQVFSLTSLVQMRAMNLRLEVQNDGALIATFQVRPMLHDRIKKAQSKDPMLHKKIEAVKQGKDKGFEIHNDVLWIGSRVCVPDVDNIHKEILEEAHCAPYAMYPGMTKMYNTLRAHFWWPKMKKDIAKFVLKCLTCQKIKMEHQTLAGKLQPLEIPK